MLTIAIGLYVLAGFIYYLSLRRDEGPQGIGGLVASLTLGGLTVFVLFAIALVAAVGYGLVEAGRYVARTV